MKRALLRNLTLYTHNLLSPPTFKPNPNNPFIVSLASLTSAKLRFFSSHNDSSSQNQSPTQPHNKDSSVDVEDVSNQEVRMLIDKFSMGDYEAIPLIFEAILKRRLSRKHKESDDELMEEILQKPVDSVEDKEFESDSQELPETDEDVEDLSNAKEILMKKMVKDK